MTSWHDTFTQRQTSAEAAVRAIHPGQRVFLTGNCSVPKMLLRALCDHAPALHDVEIVQVLAVGENEYVRPELQRHLRVNTMFISENVRDAVNDGRADFTPIFLSDIPRLFRSEMPFDVALIQVSPPDAHGFCSFGIEVGVTKTAAEVAKSVIAEVNSQMPRTLGDSFIHISKIDLMVPVDYALPEIRPEPASALQESIAKHIATLIEDGSTLQTGIGGIPDAVLKYLHDKQRLGIHSELFSDGVVDLVARGVITNEAKSIHRGKIIAGFVLGTQKVYDFIDDNPIVELHPTEYVNNPYLISQNDKMVAINSAIEVDLTGQVCADSIGHRFYSGAGGQVDFIRGAARSKGGKPIIALPSTAKHDTVSRLVCALKPGAGVITTRNDVHYVVTEYGIAYLHGKTIRDRVRALIGIAHPNFREALEAEAYQVGILPRLVAKEWA
jgi:acetyl-CoA hydrolase